MVLHPTFKAMLRQALASSSTQAQQVDELVYTDLPSAKDTAAYAEKQWQVGPVCQVHAPSRLPWSRNPPGWQPWRPAV
jgi:hypothetical protein